MRELPARTRALLLTALAAGLVVAGLALTAPAPRAAAQTPCVSTIDLVLVLDGSESISPASFETMRAFVGDLVGHFTISPGDAHVGVVQFAGEGQGRIETAVSGDPAVVLGAVASMSQIVGATDLQEGIAYGQGELTTAARGVPQVMIVLTDGVHNQPGDPLGEALAARGLGTQIFAIAVGSEPDVNQLVSISGDADRVFSVDSFDALVTILDPLVEVVCQRQIDPPDSSTPFPPGSSPDGPPDTNELLPLTLPETGAHDLPPDWLERGRPIMAQAAIGLAAAGLLMMGAYWFTRRERR